MKTPLLLIAALALTVSSAMAQTYTATELAGGSNGNAISGGLVSGQTGAYDLGRATIWDADGAATDVHPTFLATSAGPGFSNIWGRSGSISVGLGQKNDDPNRAMAIKWTGATASLLPSPFNAYASVALATDGSQIVGWAAPMQTVRGRPSPGLMHPLIWDAITGKVLADLWSGKVATLWAVANGQQVGSDTATGAAQARMWKGTAKSMISLHPKGYSSSEAYATDGTHQVGMVGNSVRLAGEARRSPEVFMTSAAVWSGTAASLKTLPFVAPGANYSTAMATGVSGDMVCGYGMAKNRTGLTTATHAVVWNLAAGTWTDLHDTLPTGYSDSRANAVDARGNITGYAIDAAGVYHAIQWRVN